MNYPSQKRKYDAEMETVDKAYALLNRAALKGDTQEDQPATKRIAKPIRLMTDAERRAAGLDPNGGFDGPTGAD